jgi:tetratricopeptide (TPR) repeat protein
VEQTGDPELLITVAFVAVQIYGWRGRPAQALAICERGIELAGMQPALGRAGRFGRLLLEAASALETLGRLDEAAACVQRAAEQAERTNDVQLRGLVALERGWFEHLRGEHQRALLHMERAVRIGQEIGSGEILGPSLTMMGAVYCLLERWASAVDTLAMIADMTQRGRATFEPIALSFLAEAYAGAGDMERARTTAAAALAAARRRGTKSYETRARLAEARVLLRSGAAATEIAPVLDELTALVDETGARDLEPHLHLERAELARRLGDAAGRDRELRLAREQFVAMGCPAMVARIDAQINVPVP